MEKTQVQRLARVLWWLVLAVLAVNLLSLLLVPGLSALLADGGPAMIWRALAAAMELEGYEGQGLPSLPLFFLNCLWAVWLQRNTALLTLFYWLCGSCTALILWQAKRVLDTILTGDPFRMSNARALRRAAVCCWFISGCALVRLVAWLWSTAGPAPIFTYNTLFIPAFLMAGLLFLVMSALFRQAAELKEDQDLTI